MNKDVFINDVGPRDGLPKSNEDINALHIDCNFDVTSEQVQRQYEVGDCINLKSF